VVREREAIILQTS